MGLFDNLMKRVGLGGGAGQAVKGLQQGAGVGARFGGNPQMQPSTMRSPIDAKMAQFQEMQPARYKQPMAEDDGMVQTNSGDMPLSSVNPGQAWRNPQNGYGRGLMVRPNYGMQGFGRGQEDDYSPNDALTNRSYGNRQTSVHGGLQQGGMPQQPNGYDYLRKLLGL